MKKKIKSRKKKGFLLPAAAYENYELGREILDDPKGFLKRSGLKLSELGCPSEVHAALRRAKRFSREVPQLDSPAQLLRMSGKIKKLAAKHFGKDFEVAPIPYGLRFREKMKIFRDDWTVSGSVTITFCDGDTDVDD